MIVDRAVALADVVELQMRHGGSLSALDTAGGQAGHDLALEDQDEHDQRHGHDDRAAMMMPQGTSNDVAPLRSAIATGVRVVFDGEGQRTGTRSRRR